MGELIRDNHWQHDATIGDLSAIRVVIVPIGGKSDELSKYASLVLANTTLELASVKSFYTEHESSPFVSQSWDTGQLRFRFMYTDGARISSLGANGQLPVEAMAPDCTAAGSHFRLSRERSMSTNAMALAGAGATGETSSGGWAPRARQGAMLNVQNVKTAPSSPIFPNGLHSSPSASTSGASPGNGGAAPPAASSMSARVRHLLQPRTLGSSASSPDLMAEGKAKSMAPGSYHGVYDDVQSNRKILGVIGVCFCPATPKIGEAYAEFLDICRYFHDALAVRCFCFDPTDAHVEQDDSSRQFLVLLPPGDTSYLEFHINTLMQDFGAALLMEAEKVVHALLQLLKAETLGVTPAASGESAGMLGGRSEELRLHKKRRITRLEKTIADYCLIAGSPADAFTYYALASESATMCNDLMWAAAAMEGTACCVYQQPKVLQPDDVESIITSYKEAIALYGRLAISILELEAVFKLARFYAEAGNKQAAIQQVTTLMGMSGRMTLSARVSLFLEIAGVYESVRYYHKQVYHIREAALECRLAGSAQKALPLLLSTAEVYCRPNSSHCDWALKESIETQAAYWPGLQKAMLQETLELAMQANDALTSWMAAAQLLREHHTDLSDEAQRSLLNDMVRCARLLPHGTQCTTPGLPLVRVLSYPTPPAHMWAVEWQRKKRANAGKGLFIYSPMDAAAGKGGGKKGRTNAPAAASNQQVVWIVGELGEVVVEMSNPCPFEVSVDCIHLITDQEDFEALPLTAYLPAFSKKIVTLVGVPRRAGQLKVLGCAVRCLGMLTEHHCGGSHAPDGSVVGADCAKAVEVVPPLPLLVPRLCSAMGRPLRPDSDKAVDAAERVGVYPGEVRKLTVLLRNIGATTVRQVDVTTLCRRGMLSVDASALLKSLPLAKGSSVLLPMTINAASSSLKEGACTNSSVTIEYTGKGPPEESTKPAEGHPPSGLSKSSSNTESIHPHTAGREDGPVPNGALPNDLPDGVSSTQPPTTTADPAKPAVIHGRELAINVEIEMRPGLRLLGARVLALEDAPPSVVRALVLASRGLPVDLAAGAPGMPRVPSSFSFGANPGVVPSASPFGFASAVPSPYAPAGASPYGLVGDADLPWFGTSAGAPDAAARAAENRLTELSLSPYPPVASLSLAPSMAGTVDLSRQGSTHGGAAPSLMADASAHLVVDNLVCLAPFVVDVAEVGGGAPQLGAGGDGGLAQASSDGHGGLAGDVDRVTDGGVAVADARASTGGHGVASGEDHAISRAGSSRISTGCDHGSHPTHSRNGDAASSADSGFYLLEVCARNEADYPFRIEAPCGHTISNAATSSSSSSSAAFLPPGCQWVTRVADAIVVAAGAVLGDTGSMLAAGSGLLGNVDQTLSVDADQDRVVSGLGSLAGGGPAAGPGSSISAGDAGGNTSIFNNYNNSINSNNGNDKPPPGGILVAASPRMFRSVRRYYDGDDYEAHYPGGSGGALDAINGGGSSSYEAPPPGHTRNKSVGQASVRSGSENMSRTESGLSLGVPIAAEGIASGKVSAAVDAAIAQLARAGVNSFTPRDDGDSGGVMARQASGPGGFWGLGDGAVTGSARQRTWGDDGGGQCVLCTIDPGDVARVYVPMHRRWLERGSDDSSSSSSSRSSSSSSSSSSSRRSSSSSSGKSSSSNAGTGWSDKGVVGSRGGAANGPVTSAVVPDDVLDGSTPGGAPAEGASLPPLAPGAGGLPFTRSSSLPQPARKKRQVALPEATSHGNAGVRDQDDSGHRVLLDEKGLEEEMKRYRAALARAVSLHWRSAEGNTGQLLLEPSLLSGLDAAALDALRPPLLSFALDVTEGGQPLACSPRSELSVPLPRPSALQPFAPLDGFGSGFLGTGPDVFPRGWPLREPLSGNEREVTLTLGGGHAGGGYAGGGYAGGDHPQGSSLSGTRPPTRMRAGQVVDVKLGCPIDLSLWLGNPSPEPLHARLGMSCQEVSTGADALVVGGSSAADRGMAAAAGAPSGGQAVMWMGCFQQMELEVPCYGSTPHAFALCFLRKGIFSLVPKCEIVQGISSSSSTGHSPEGSGHVHSDTGGGQGDLIDFGTAAAVVPQASCPLQATVVVMSEGEGSATCQIDRVKDGEAYALKRLCKGQPFFFQVT